MIVRNYAHILTHFQNSINVKNVLRYFENMLEMCVISNMHFKNSSKQARIQVFGEGGQ